MNMIHDSLGTRMKAKYEDVFRHSIPQRTYAIIRIDGKAFHTFTKKLPRPYCAELSLAMDTAAGALCKEIMGAQFAYGQSDEYSFLFTDFQSEESEMWFNGNIQKIVSVASSIFTAHFNEAWRDITAMSELRKLAPAVALFDARLFVIPSYTEVINYFVWRQNDATRNSLSMFAQSFFSAKELHGKNGQAKHDMLHGIGQNWNNCSTEFKRGRVIQRVESTRQVTFTHKATKQQITREVSESAWARNLEIPIFTKDHSFLGALIPSQESKVMRA